MMMSSMYRWEKDDNYCLTLLKPTSDYYHLLPDILDTTVLDFLVGNADRHHFETYALLGKKGHLMHIDNGKRSVMLLLIIESSLLISM